MEKQKMLSVVGFVATIPATLLCLSGLSGLNPPPFFTHPALILGGLALALTINVLPVMHIRTRVEDDNFVGTVTIRLKGTLMSFGVITLSLLLLSTIAIYLFVENFQPR